MKSIIPTFSIFLILLFVATSEVNACWCRNDPEETNTPEKFSGAVAQTFRKSTLVFTGKVIGGDERFSKFQIEQIWKGKDEHQIFLTLDNYVLLKGSDGNRDYFIDSCSYKFEVGKTYLVYATTQNGNYVVSKCGRTQVLSEAKKDVEELHKFKKSTKPLNNVSLQRLGSGQLRPAIATARYHTDFSSPVVVDFVDFCWIA